MTDLQLQFEVSTDLKGSVETFRRLQRSIGESRRALGESQAATAALAREMKAAQAQADGLRVQLALGRRELERQASATGKNSVEYLSLKQALKQIEGELGRADQAAKSSSSAFERSLSVTRRLAADIDRQAQAREHLRRGLVAEGVDVRNLAGEYARLQREQSARAGAQAARQTLGIRSSRDIAAEIKQVKDAYATLAASGQASLRELSRAQQAMTEQVKRLKAELRGATATPVADARQTLGIRSSRDIAAEIKQVQAAYATLAASGQASLRELSRAQQAMIEQVKRLKAELRGATAKPLADARQTLGIRGTADIQAEIAKVRAAYATLAASGRASIQELARAHQAAADKIKALNAEMAGTQRSVNLVGGGIRALTAAVGGLLAVGSLTAGAGELVRTAAAWDRINAVLTVTEGDARKALETLNWLKGVSKELGLELRPTVDSFAKLNASVKGTAMEGEPVRRVFVSLVGAMTRMGSSSERIQLALDAVGQMISKVVVNADDLRQQLGDHLYGAMKRTADAMGLSVVKLNEMMASGRLLADDMLPKLARELDRSFGTGKIDTITANLNRLSTAWDQFKQTIGDTAHIKDVIEWLANAVEKLNDTALTSGKITVEGKSFEQLQELHDALIRRIAETSKGGSSAPAVYLKALREVSAALSRIEEQQKRVAELAAIGPPRPPTLTESDSLFLDSLKTSDQKAVEAIQSKIEQLRTMRDKVVAVLGEARYQALQASLDKQLAEAVRKTEDKLGKGETRFDAAFAAATTKYGLPPGLLKAIADVESGFNPKATNPSSGAQGLMQLMPDTARRYGVADAYDPDQAIEGTAKYLAKLFEEMGGDVVKVIAAYNSLSAYKAARAGKFDIAALPGESRDYVGKVAGKLGEYGNLQVDVKALENQAQLRRKLAEGAAQFEADQRKAALEDAARADQAETARLEAAYQARTITASEYYRQLTALRQAAAQRQIAAILEDIRAENARQDTRQRGAEDYLQGERRIFDLIQQIAAVRDSADLEAANNARALAAANKEQAQALGDQLAQMKLRLLEAQAEGGKSFADIVVSPEQAELVRQRLEVLRNQYRDLLEQLRQSGNTDGLNIAEQFIRAEALQDLQGRMDQATEFGIQAARNIQSGFAEFLFDPFQGGLSGMARGFLETVRRMAAEAASASLMRGLLGEDFEKGKLGGLLADVVGYFRGAGAAPAAPYPQGSVPDSLQVGPVAPAEGAEVAAARTAANAVETGRFDRILAGFEDGFTQIFDGDFFSGLGNIMQNGFGGLFGWLSATISGLFSGGGNSGNAELKLALSLVGVAASAYGGSIGTAVSAAAGATNSGINAVDVSSAGSRWGGSFQSGTYHKGGLVGPGGERRNLPAVVFAGAPRYHVGGLAGLKPDEVPAILMGGPKGQREEVLTANDPRHRDNLDSARSRPSPATPPASPTTNIINVLDPSLVDQYLRSRAGERHILNIISRNPGAVRKVVGGG
jgi:tape measure domain-containing protein